jgi:hypothetical protein
MRKPRRKDLEQLVSAVEAARPRQAIGSAEQRAQVAIPRGDEALAKAIEGIPGLADLRSAAEQVEAERADALRQYVDLSKAAAAEHAAAMLDRRGLFDDQAPEPDGIAPEIEPSLPVYFLRASAGASLVDQQIADGDTWAKWTCTVSGDAIRTTTTEKLSFFFLYHNPKKRNLRVDITSGFRMAGHASAHAEGHGFPASLFFPDSRVDMGISARLTAWPLWLANAPQPFQSMDVASLGVSGGSWSHSEAAEVAASPALQTISFFVPQGAYLLIEMGISVDFSVLGGEATLDFASEDGFRVDFPYCYVTI